LHPATTTATSIGDAISAGTVPRHPYHLGSIVTVIRRPPIDRGVHQLPEILFELLVVNFRERVGVVNVMERISLNRILMQQFDLETIGPPRIELRLSSDGTSNPSAAKRAVTHRRRSAGNSGCRVVTAVAHVDGALGGRRRLIRWGHAGLSVGCGADVGGFGGGLVTR